MSILRRDDGEEAARTLAVGVGLPAVLAPGAGPMIAGDFTHDDCQLGTKRVSYARLQREYRCNDCGGRLVQRWTERCESYPAGWHVECGACGSHDFIHEREIRRQRAEADEVLDGLPADLRGMIEPKHGSPQTFETSGGSITVTPEGIVIGAYCSRCNRGGWTATCSCGNAIATRREVAAAREVQS
jgi:DNA-directed RNA polymerase subunit RPC12/RpoP